MSQTEQFMSVLPGVARACPASDCPLHQFSASDCPSSDLTQRLRGKELYDCIPWLTCRHINNSTQFEIIRELGHGAVKTVFLCRWCGIDVVLNRLRDTSYRDDFRHGLDMLTRLQMSHHVTRLYGQCHDSYVTQYYRFGSADKIHELFENKEMMQHNNVISRFRLCVNYAEIVSYLHSSPIGTRVLCDSNDLHKTLSQFLLTDSLQLVANDLDALPEVTRVNSQYRGLGAPAFEDHPAEGATGKIKCGRRQIVSDFVAPEQLWSNQNAPFDDALMIGYDEKTDVWKIPDVCEYFLNAKDEWDVETSLEEENDYEEGEEGGEGRGVRIADETLSLLFHLFSVHRRCKVHEPSQRSSAQDVLREYQRVWTHLFPHAPQTSKQMRI